MATGFQFISNNITYRLRFPDYPVNLFADHFVIMNGCPGVKQEFLFPNNKAELFFNLGEKVEGVINNHPSVFQLKQSVISGVRDEYFTFRPGDDFFIAGLRFTLFGFYLLNRIPARHFTNAHFNTQDVWGMNMDLIREQLFESDSFDGMFGILENWIRKKITDENITEIKKWRLVSNYFQQQEVPVSSILEEKIGYSQRYSIHLVKEMTGLPPKSVQRINRFDQVLRSVNKKMIPDWIKLVVDCGYSDQSHLIREFRQFTGMTPTEYIRLKPREYVFREHLDNADEGPGR